MSLLLTTYVAKSANQLEDCVGMKRIWLIRVMVIAIIFYIFCMYMFGYQSKNRNKTPPRDNNVR